MQIMTLRVVNVLLFISVLVQASTVICLEFFPEVKVFPLHAWNGVILILLIGCHIFLNIGWIKANFFRIKKK